jgi:hypothetical protein
VDFLGDYFKGDIKHSFYGRKNKNPTALRQCGEVMR